MAGIVSNIIQNSVGGFVTGAVTTVGGYAGDAVGGIGNLIEGAGARVGNGIAGRFNSVGQGINSYGDSIKNATAPNAGGAVAVKKTAVKKTDGKPAQKALPSSKPMKALPAPSSKTKTPYTPPSAVKKIEPAKKAPLGTNGQKKVMPQKQSLPAYKPPTDQKPLYAAKSSTPASAKDYKPAIPGYGPADKAGSKAGSVAGSAKPKVSSYSNPAKKAPSAAGSYKPAVGGYGDKAKSQAGSAAGSVAGGPKFF